MNRRSSQTLEQSTSPERAEAAIASKPVLSAIWIYSGDEPDCLETLNQYVDALINLSVTCELVVVVNGTAGPTEQMLEMLASVALDSHLAQIHRPSDESTAIRAGLEVSHGDLIALLPDYVQVDPVAVEDMLAEVQKGANYVASWRNPRIDSRWGASKSWLFNQSTSYMTGVTLHDINSGLRLMTREVAEHVPIYGDLHRFSPILAALQGFSVTEVQVCHLRERRVEKGDSRFGVYLRRTLDLITLFFLFKFTKKPLRFFGLIGSVSLVLGILMISTMFIQRLYGAELAERPLLLLGVVFAVLGVQLFSVGLLGELIIFTHGRDLFHQHVTELKPERETSLEKSS